MNRSSRAYKIGTEPGKPRRWRVSGLRPLTEFQGRVLREVAKIPKGRVRSYAYIAKRIGSPGAARAVGQALKRNPYAPQVPCHRVIASDGSIGGYSAPGGIRKKRALLRKEGVVA